MSREADLRAAIVAEALSWEGTPYLPFARVKGVGTDCAQYPAAVFAACGIIPELHPKYSQQWMHHRDEELYLAEIRQWAREIPVNESKPGDLIVWKFGRTFSHSAIVIELPLVIHAVIKGGAVIRCNIDEEEDYKAGTRPRKAFSVFDARGKLLKRKVRD